MRTVSCRRWFYGYSMPLSLECWRSILFVLLILFLWKRTVPTTLALGLYFCFPKRFTLSATFKILYAGTLALPVLYFSLALFFSQIWWRSYGFMLWTLIIGRGARFADGAEKHLPKPTYIIGSLFTGKKMGYIFNLFFRFLTLVQKTLSTYSFLLLAVNLLMDWP